MSKYTQGPWVYEDRGQTVHVHGDLGKRIADVRGWGWLQYGPNPAEQQQANGKLVAAAPDLLRELDLCCDALEHMASDAASRGDGLAAKSLDRRAFEARAFIRLARGES